VTAIGPQRGAPLPAESPLEVVVLVFSVTVLVVLMNVVVRRDERRLDEESLERAWPPSSRDSALIGLSLLGSPIIGLLAVWFHFWRTRRWHPKGFLLGGGFAIGILLVNVLLVTALALVLGLPLDD
jgi:hypothetical protein